MNFIKFLLIIITTSFCSQVWADNNNPKMIMTTIKPIAGLIKDLAGEEVKADYLIKKGSAHSYALKIKDLKLINQADYFIILGEKFEPFINKFANKINQKKIINLSEIANIKFLPLRNKCNHHNHENHDEEAHEHNEAHLDPHFWLNEENIIQIASFITQKLISLKPNSKIKFLNNLKLFKSQIRIVKNEFLNIPKISHEYFITHDSLQYLEKDFNIKFSEIIYTDNSHYLKPDKLLHLTEASVRENIKCLVVEQEFNNRNTLKLAKKLKMTPTFIDLEGNKQKDYSSQISYVKIFNDVTKNIAECLK